MGVVYYQPRQTHTVKEVKRSPLGKFAAWAIKKASGTIFEGIVKFFLGKSVIGRFASVIVVSLVLGAIIDLTIVSIPTLSSSTNTVGMIVTTTAVLGAIAGAGAGGLGGAVVGALWGWLIGEISDAIVTEATAEQVSGYIGPFITWVIATLTGLLAGKLASWGFEKISLRHTKLGRFIRRVFVLIALGALGFVVFEVIKLVIGK